MKVFLENFKIGLGPLILSVLLFNLFFAADLSAENSFKIINVIPSGDNVENINQIAIQFSRPVIAFGSNSEVNLPIKIEPGIDCKWQWVNVDLAICYLNQSEKLKLSTSYKLKVVNGFKAFDGAEFVGEKEFRFSTLHPDILNWYIRSWKNQGKPVIQITFNQFVDKNSIEKVLYFTPDDGGEGGQGVRYGVSLFDEKKLLSEYEIKNLSDEFYSLFKNDKEKIFDNSRKIVFIQPTQDLPAGKKFKLVLDNGLKSIHGSELNMGAREIVSFKTFDKPEFLGIRCSSHSSGKYEDITISVNNMVNDSKKCLPNNGINLLFSSPIKKSEALKYLRFTPELSQDIINNIYDQFENAENVQKEKDFGYYVNSENDYQIGLFGNFRANQIYNVKSISRKNEDLQEKIKNFFSFSKSSSKDENAFDIFGRKLEGKIDFSFHVDHCEPQLFFPHYEDINVLEYATKNDVQLTARNFKNLSLKYSIISDDINSRNQEITKNIHAKEDVFVKVPIGIREILNGKTGLIFGELFGYPTDSSYPVSKNIFMTQVTNFGIIGKIGHYNSLVYVTDLISGAPIRNANVKFLKSKFLDFNGDESQVIATGKTDEDGIAILQGTANFDKSLKAMYHYYDGDGLIIQVEKNNEMGWLPIRHNHMMSLVNSSNIYSSLTKKYNHLLSWGFTSQGIYKVGEEVKYKIFVRNNENDSVKKADDLSYKVQILDKVGKVVHEKDGVRLSEFGFLSDSFQLGKNAETGWYDIVLIPNLNDKGVEKDQYESDFTMNSCRFLVSDFKPSPFRIRTELNKKKVFYGDELEISNYGEFYSGGAYSNANISVNVDVEPRIFDPSMNNPALNDFTFYDDKQQNLFLQRVLLRSDKLNQVGEFVLKTKVENNDIPYGDIVVDSNVQDDNGKTISSRSFAKYYGVDKFVGLKAADWFFNKGEKSGINFAVTDSSGNFVKDVDVNLQVQRSDVNIAQVRTGGDMYSPQNLILWENVDSCNKKSGSEIDKCDFVFNKAGNYRVTATIRDGKNRIHTSSISFVVFDSGEQIVWKQDNNENFEIVAEKNEYKVGDKARFMIKNPLIGANALITIERYGILKQFTKKFDNSLEILEFDLNEKDAPGFYLSVVLTMPRLKNDNPDSAKNSVDYSSDMYKPIAKIGYSKILVSDPNRHLKVNILTNKDLYQPKESVNLKLNIDETSVPNEIDVTVLVIDDAVLDLVRGGVNYFDPREAFSQLQNLDVMNYSLFKTILTNSRVAMMKGADQGGDAGFDMSVRANFENLAFFKDSIILKKGQKKEINFTLPDNLTSWRVVVVSNDKDGLFGMDSRTFKVNKETEIRSLLPHHVLAGDKFNGSFTVFNRSDKRRVLKFDVTLSGAISKSSMNSTVYNEEIVLDPYTRKVVSFPVFSIDIDNLKDSDKIKFIVKAHDSSDSDGAEFFVDVLPTYIVENIFDNKIISPDDQKFTRDIKISDNASSNFSSMKVTIGNSILNNIVNIFSFIKDYKYNCLEQSLSKLLVSVNYLNLKDSNKNIFADFIWENAYSVAEQSFKRIFDYQAENGGFAYYTPNNNYVDQYLSVVALDVLTKVSKINQDFQPSQIGKTKLIDYLKTLLRYDSNYNAAYGKSIIADVKAFVIDVLVRNNEANLSDLMRFEDNFERMSMFGKAKMFSAAVNLHADSFLIEKFLKNIMQYKVVSGGKYISFERNNSDYSWISHSTKYTENCAVLSSFLNLEKKFEFYGSLIDLSKKDLADIIGKLADGIANHSLNSEANKMFSTHEAMICVDALSDYARLHEARGNNKNEKVELIFKSKDGSDILNQTIFVPDTVKIDDLSSFKNNDVTLKVVRKNLSSEDENLPNYKNNIYYNAVLSLFNKLNFTDGYNRGIGISRRYQIQKDEKFVDVDDLSQFKSGDIVKVILKVNAPSDRYFVVVDDYIPGCFEPVDDNIETAIKIRDNHSDFYYKDLKKDYARFYSEYLRSGEYEVSYFVQVVSKGKFSALPAKVVEMYNNDIGGSTKADIIFAN